MSRQSIGKDIRELKAKTQTWVDEKDAMMVEHQDLVKRKAKLELHIGDMQNEMDGDKSAKVRGKWELLQCGVKWVLKDVISLGYLVNGSQVPWFWRY